jgi:ZIP family zinc transporter
VEWFASLHPVLQGLLATLFTYFMTAAGAAVVFFCKKDTNKRVLNFMIGASAGSMLAAAFWSLLEPAVSISAELGFISWLVVAGGFFVGAVFISGCDLLSRGEQKRSVLLTLAVGLHNIPEGLAVGAAFGCVAVGVSGATLGDAIVLAFGIALQNFPEGLCVSMPLAMDGVGRTKSFMIGQASGLVEPIAGVIGVLFAITVRAALPFVLSFAAGAMIVVVIGELIPTAFAENKKTATFGAIFGFVTMMILDIALG